MAWVENIQTNFKNILASRDFSDRLLIVGQGKEQITFHVHSWLLSMFSIVFGTMFYGSMAKTNKVFRLPEDDPKALEIIINYIYTGTLKTETHHDIIKIYGLADEYMITFLKKECLLYLLKNISEDTVIENFESSIYLDEDPLFDNCLKYINFSKVLKNDSFKKARLSTLRKIVSWPILNFSSELEICQAVIEWDK